MAAEGGPVAPAGAGPSSAARGAERGHVVDGGPGERQERLEVQADRGRHPLDLAEQRHHVVRRDAGRGVVGRPVAVVDLDHPAAEALDISRGHRGAGDGEGHPRAQPGRTDLTVGQRHERVQRRPHAGAGARASSPSEPERCTTVVALDGDDRGRDLGHGVVGRGDDEHVDAVGGAGHVVVAPGEPANSQPRADSAAARDVPARPGPMIRMECI